MTVSEPLQPLAPLRPSVRFMLSHPAHFVALGFGAGLAKATGGRIRLLNVMDPLAHISGFERPDVYSQEVLPRLRQAGDALLRRAQERVAQSGVPVDTVLIENLDARVADLVVEHAKTWGADLIVLGTHGRRGLARVLMGSDAEQIARTAPVPVLLVRLPAGADGSAANA